jgi:hypothetical protein
MVLKSAFQRERKVINSLVPIFGDSAWMTFENTDGYRVIVLP